MKVYLVAGEPSGDKLGAELMAGLKSCAPYELDFCGVGGFLMEEYYIKIYLLNLPILQVFSMLLLYKQDLQ